MRVDIIRVHFDDDWLTLVRFSEHLWIDVGAVREALQTDKRRGFHEEPSAKVKTASAPGREVKACDRFVVEWDPLPAWLANMWPGRFCRERFGRIARQCGRARGDQLQWEGAGLPSAASANPLLARLLAEMKRHRGLWSSVSDLLARMTGQIERLCRQQEELAERLAKLERPAAEEQSGPSGSEPVFEQYRSRRNP